MTERSVGGTRCGFTLVEVMLVVVVLGCLVSVAVPRLSGSLDAARLKSAAEGIERTARLARAQARAGGKICELVYDLDTRTYGLRVLSDVEASGWLTRGSAEAGLTSVGRLPDKILVNWPGEQVIRFFPDGQSEAVLIVLESSRGRCLELAIKEFGEHVTRCD